MELVIGSDFLNDLIIRVLKDDEVTNQIEESLFLEDTLDEYFKLQIIRIRDTLALDRLPGKEPLPPRGQQTQPRLISA